MFSENFCEILGTLLNTNENFWSFFWKPVKNLWPQWASVPSICFYSSLIIYTYLIISFFIENMYILTFTSPPSYVFDSFSLKISTQSELMKHALLYSYILQINLFNFRPSYRHDFGVFCVYKVGRDPPLNLTFSIMKWEVQKTAGICAARALNKEYLVNKLNKKMFINIFF